MSHLTQQLVLWWIYRTVCAKIYWLSCWVLCSEVTIVAQITCFNLYHIESINIQYPRMPNNVDSYDFSVVTIFLFYNVLSNFKVWNADNNNNNNKIRIIWIPVPPREGKYLPFCLCSVSFAWQSYISSKHQPIIEIFI